MVVVVNLKIWTIICKTCGQYGLIIAFLQTSLKATITLFVLSGASRFFPRSKVFSLNNNRLHIETEQVNTLLIMVARSRPFKLISIRTQFFFVSKMKISRSFQGCINKFDPISPSLNNSHFQYNLSLKKSDFLVLKNYF